MLYDYVTRLFHGNAIKSTRNGIFFPYFDKSFSNQYIQTKISELQKWSAYLRKLCPMEIVALIVIHFVYFPFFSEQISMRQK